MKVKIFVLFYQKFIENLYFQVIVDPSSIESTVLLNIGATVSEALYYKYEDYMAELAKESVSVVKQEVVVEIE